MTKQDLIELIDSIPDGEPVVIESVIGDAFNFDCKVRVFFNEDNEDWRVRIEGTDSNQFF